MKYPRVLGEVETLTRALDGACLSRFGDGELKLALGANCVSQVGTPKLAIELRSILAGDFPKCLPCIPNCGAKTKTAWAQYGDPKYIALYRHRGDYGSSFITRPDSAPWIDTPEYWATLKRLWEGKDVVLVKGTERSLREETLTGVGSIRVVGGPRRDAYAVVDEIEEEIGKPSGPVLMCLGATATVLAARLAQKGVHAIDLGHVGMFMRHAGAYRYTRDDFISGEYRAQLEMLHKQRKWGNDGGKHAEHVHLLAVQTGVTTILDYGCGEGALGRAWKERGYIESGIRIMEYDPGMDGKAGLPKPVEMTVCTDVLEHVEPDKLDAVLDHMFRITGQMAYVVIATRPANAVLPDGRNAHLIVEDWAWWSKKLKAVGWKISRVIERDGRDVSLCLTK